MPRRGTRVEPGVDGCIVGRHRAMGSRKGVDFAWLRSTQQERGASSTIVGHGQGVRGASAFHRLQYSAEVDLGNIWDQLVEDSCIQQRMDTAGFKCIPFVCIEQGRKMGRLARGHQEVEAECREARHSEPIVRDRRGERSIDWKIRHQGRCGRRDLVASWPCLGRTDRYC